MGEEKGTGKDHEKSTGTLMGEESLNEEKGEGKDEGKGEGEEGQQKGEGEEGQSGKRVRAKKKK